MDIVVEISPGGFGDGVVDVLEGALDLVAAAVGVEKSANVGGDTRVDADTRGVVIGLESVRFISQKGEDA